MVNSPVDVLLFALIWLGGAVALAASAFAFGKWMLVAAAAWLVPVGWVIASQVVLVVL